MSATDYHLRHMARPSRAERRQGEIDRAMAELLEFADRLPLRDRDLGAMAAAVARLNAMVAAECHARLGGTEAPTRVVHRDPFA